MEAKNDQAINSGNTSVCRQVAESVPVELDKRIMCFLNGVNLIANPKYPLTDLGAGQLFADCFTDEACYVAERCCWFVYIFGVWQPDIDGELTMALCKKLAIALKSYAKSIENESLRKFAERWQSRKSRETFIKDAQSCNYRHVREFDKDICVVNCKNGTLHLNTMEFTQHRPSDLLTKSLNADYDPAAHDERFDRFIDEICSGDTDKSRFLQKSLGYALSGSTSYECFFIFYGATSRNGKGTLCESVLSVMGSYGRTARPESIAARAKNAEAQSEDIARLAGARFVNISEPDKNLVLNAALIKSLSGNDTINARYLHENSFDFKPQFKLYINTNYQPIINDMTVFESGRVKLIPFNRFFEEQERDTDLKNQFLQPACQSAILNWLLEGYRLLQEEGLQMPQVVRDAEKEYSRESDKIRLFVDDMLVAGCDYEVRSVVAYAAYQMWCECNGYGIDNIRNFTKAMRRFAKIVQKRPAGGGNPTSILLGYQLVETQCSL